MTNLDNVKWKLRVSSNHTHTTENFTSRTLVTTKLRCLISTAWTRLVDKATTTLQPDLLIEILLPMSLEGKQRGNLMGGMSNYLCWQEKEKKAYSALISLAGISILGFHYDNIS